MFEHIEIENDVFDIAFEIKKIDSNYSIKYNKIKKRFELHHKNYKPTLQLVFPFESLDYRCVIHTYKTLNEKIFNELEKIDDSNKKLEEKLEKNLSEEINYKAKNIFNYYNNGHGELLNYENI